MGQSSCVSLIRVWILKRRIQLSLQFFLCVHHIYAKVTVSSGHGHILGSLTHVMVSLDSLYTKAHACPDTYTIRAWQLQYCTLKTTPSSIFHKSDKAI